MALPETALAATGRLAKLRRSPDLRSATLPPTSLAERSSAGGTFRPDAGCDEDAEPEDEPRPRRRLPEHVATLDGEGPGFRAFSGSAGECRLLGARPDPRPDVALAIAALRPGKGEDQRALYRPAIADGLEGLVAPDVA